VPSEHAVAGKDAALESSIERRQEKLTTRGFHVEPCAWLNPIDGVWSLPIGAEQRGFGFA
jgi:ribosomal protein S12 methylthiotransferase accessory factor